VPKKITLPFIPIGVPGYQKPHPFGDLHVGDILRVPTLRCGRHSVTCSVRRFQDKHPGKFFRVTREPVDGYHEIERVQ